MLGFVIAEAIATVAHNTPNKIGETALLESSDKQKMGE
jgi:hypothetical protein